MAPPSGQRDPMALVAVPALVSLAALGLYLATTARTITWAHGGADGAELSAAAATLGVAHPTGYPLYLLLAWLFTLVPAGEVAFRVALLSVVCAAIAAGLAAHVVAAISSRPSALSAQHPPLRRRGWRALLGPAAAGFGLALSPLFWSQATIPEVYSLHALLVLLLVAATARWRPGNDRSLVAMALLAGIGLGNHLTLALLLAPVALYLMVEDPGVLRRRALPMAVVAFLAGLSIYLYIPIRAAASPALNWGNPVDPASFLSHIAATSYYGYIGNRPAADALARVPVMARLMGEQLTWPGLVVSILGLTEMLFRRRRLSLALLGYLLLTLLFTLFYNADNGQVYLIPATIVLALGLGVGVASLVTGRVGAWLALATLAILIPWQLWNNLPSMDLSSDQEAALYARGALASAPLHGVLATERDEQTFALWYTQTVDGLRPDVAVVDRRLVAREWYRDQIRRSHPGALEKVAQ